MHKLFSFAQNPRMAMLVLTVLGAAMFLPGFFTVPPIDRDEARFAQASKQMIESNNFFDIHFQDEVRYKKPIGIYWLQVGTTEIFGKPLYNEIWTYRLPSLLAAIASLWLTYVVGRALISPQVGFVAALILSSSFIIAAEARLAKTDATLLATILLALWPLAKAYKNEIKFNWPSAALFWLAVAAGILIKGPVILLVVGLTILSLCIIEKSPKLFLSLKPLAGLGIVIVCVAPWLVAITIKSHGLFWQESVGHDMLGKVAGGQESHGLPPGTHVALLFGLFFPAIVLIISGLKMGWRSRTDRITQFLFAWIIPSWIIFEAVPTKLPHYTLPMYPALALLAALALSKLDLSNLKLRWALGIPVGFALGANFALLGIIAPSLPNFWIAPQLQQAAHGRPVILLGYAEPSAVFLLGTKTELAADGAAAADDLQKNLNAILAVTEKNAPEFIMSAQKNHLRIQQISSITGFNLGRGKTQKLILFIGGNHEN